uniref:Uncharacterized protein n=1 Tax=Rhizophora mucronata TaxID=61149 RepID=A0A2P2QJ41_RHIMU
MLCRIYLFAKSLLVMLPVIL